MKDIEYLGVGIKILGFYVLLKAFGILLNAFLMFRSVSSFLEYGIVDFFQFLTAFIFFSAAAIFIKFPIAIAKILIPRSSVENTKINFEKNNFLFCSLIILGVYILSYALPDLISNIYLLFVYSSMMFEDYKANETIAYIIRTIFEVALGLYLVAGSKNILALINKIRS